MALYLDDIARVVELDDDIAVDAFLSVRAPQPDMDQSSLRSAPSLRPRPEARMNCPTCGESLLRRVFSRHNSAKHSGGESRIGCVMCDETFQRPDALRRHNREQHGNENNPVACENCGRPVRPRAMKDHLRSRNRRNRVASSSLVLRNKSIRADTIKLGVQLKSSLVLDPLVITASLLRLETEGWLAAERPLGSRQSGVDKEPRLPSSSVASIWKLRGQVLALSIRMINSDLERCRCSSPSSTCSHFDSILQALTFRACERFIFGTDSIEVKCHDALLEQYQPTWRHRPRLDDLLTHVWRDAPEFASKHALVLSPFLILSNDSIGLQMIGMDTFPKSWPVAWKSAHEDFRENCFREMQLQFPESKKDPQARQCSFCCLTKLADCAIQLRQSVVYPDERQFLLDPLIASSQLLDGSWHTLSSSLS